MYVVHVIVTSKIASLIRVQLDLIFAVANAEGASPVKVAKRPQGDLPKAGSLEAEQVLGRANTLEPVSNEGKKRFDSAGVPHHQEV